mmetsp:Transcript_14184/g.22099  ORF Transcript_14184/g.22099 Transcript_14184/m.22099 type:complete len:87 (+) Transcript_14184:181-441(+)
MKNEVKDSFLFTENTRKETILTDLRDSLSDADLETEANNESASAVKLRESKTNSIAGLIKEGKQKKTKSSEKGDVRSIGQKVKMLD